MRRDADCGLKIAVPEIKCVSLLFIHRCQWANGNYLRAMSCHSLHRGHRALPFETIIATQLYYFQLNRSN